MAEESVARAELIRKAGVEDVDFLRELVASATQRVMQLDVAQRSEAEAEARN